ncbi:hypothetical protein EDB84DRAFT_1447294 [Lactarius hengduanensis]|nr:hypothetical protein EDB84DRAFT_1447294 [Lactarius hengduanensis]
MFLAPSFLGMSLDAESRSLPLRVMRHAAYRSNHTHLNHLLVLSHHSQPNHMFDTRLVTFLQGFTANPSADPLSDENRWTGAWNAILNALFPFSQGYFITPYRRLNQWSALMIEVAKSTDPDPDQLRALLVVGIKNGHRQDWQAGIPSLEGQLNRQIDTALHGTEPGTAVSKVYWITTIGPHWRYSVREDDGQGLRPLIAWHETLHDQASYDDLQGLTTLIADVCESRRRRV